MGLARSRTLYLALCLGLAFIALRPLPVAERALDVLLLPARLLAELSAPVGWMQGRGLFAADTSGRDDEARAHRELEEAVLASARPSGVSLPAGVQALHAEVIARPENDLDRVRIRVRGQGALPPGLPVVSGDWFVGVIAASRTPLPVGEHVVELITDGDARIGARVESAPAEPGDAGSAPCELVVGGLAPRADAVFLDVHNPSRRAVRAGRVVVHEPPALTEGATPLANGFRLGELVQERVDEKLVLGIRPGLDYKTGLYQLLVICPRTVRVAQGEDRVGVLEDGGWLSARLFLRGEPSAWREGRKLALGRTDGLREGAALVSGTRLVGRVVRAGILASDVTLLGDPGFAIPAIAMIESPAGGVHVPHVMGRIESLGRTAGGTLAFEWSATLPIEADGRLSVPARLWTGSGETGVPRGLWIGGADLPVGPGPHRIEIREPGDGREPQDLRVRASFAAPSGGTP